MRAWPSPDIPCPAIDLPPLRLFDTASSAVATTRPGPVATMYVCGITPYDATHMGHAATYLTFDLIHRYWRAAGQRVDYVQNVTDIDDPLLERADRDGIDWRELADTQTELFRSDMTALRILPPRAYVGAVESVPEVSDAVGRLLESGAAYRVADPDFPDVYFDVAATGRFGYESGYDEATMLALAAERGGDPERAGKRNKVDPLLWRMARPGEPSWESALGAGRPGWHIECAVIATGHLAARIDVQGGGVDLVFPHHECSAAHAEALTSEHPFAQHYVHTAMMTLDGEKMSKSLGNLEFVSRLTGRGTDPMAIRLALLDGHYRTERAWSADLLTSAEGRLERWRRASARQSGASADHTIKAVGASLAEDLDTPQALALLDDWAADDSLTGPAVAEAIDALLGVALS